MSSILTLPTWRHDANIFLVFFRGDREYDELETARGAGRHLVLCPLYGKVNPGCQRVVTIFSGDVAQLVRATGLYSVLASDKRKVVGSSPTVPTVFGASSNGRTRVLVPLI